SHDERLAGVIGLSTYLPDRSWLAANRSPLNLSTPVFAGHGDDDDVVPSSLGRTAADALLAAGYPLQWHSYPMPHTVCPEELDDIADFLLAVLR
ncbi:MAG: alpha/beta hydrolase, partial [Microvirgula sp.]